MAIGISLNSCMIFFMGDYREFLINENFDDGVADYWFKDTSGGINWFVTAGEYQMDGTSGVLQYTHSYYNKPEDDRFHDFYYEAAVTQYSGGTADNQCGLIFRSNNPWEVMGDPIVNFSGYMLSIRIDDVTGSFWSLERWDGGPQTILDSGLDNPVINTSWGSWNVIKVYCRENTIEVYINDSHITTVYDGIYWDGQVGLFARESAFNIFGFDNVSLWRRRDWKDDKDH